ncbi:MAG: hypothetical protein M1820_004021 [Bogoriella megaspora]|nr:MAG: hypothetical protein M1820_004021 [Bogoriella megaspora]
MPPSNTPEESSVNSPSTETLAPRQLPTPSYLSALTELETPVLDLASTLTTTTEDEADAENVRFLRRLVDTDWSAQDLATREMEADEDMDNEELPELVESTLSQNRDRILPVPEPEHFRSSERTSAQRAYSSNDSALSPYPTVRSLERLRGLAAERGILEREVQRHADLQQERGLREEEVERMTRLQNILSRLNRLQDSAYGDRVPTQQSLYDWAPANDEDDGDELEDIIRELRRQQPNTHPEILRVLGRSQLDAERESRNRAIPSRLLSSSSHQHSESSLRSAAILQSVRRHPRFAARNRDQLSRYMMDRERTGNDEDRDRSSLRSLRANLDAGRYELNRLAWQSQQRSHDTRSSLLRDLRDQRDAQRAQADGHGRGNMLACVPSPNPWLESTIKYLSRLRNSTSYEQSLSYAIDGGFATKDYFAENHEDFLLDPESLSAPPESSWLTPGMVFEGSQHATAAATAVHPNHHHGPQTGSSFASGHGSTSTTTYRLNNTQSVTSTTFEPAYGSRTQDPGFNPNYYFLPPGYRWPSQPSHVTSTAATGQENWPVRVTIHSIDYENMTLCGTMEAFGVPSQPLSYTSTIFPNASNNDNSTWSNARYLPTPSSTTPTSCTFPSSCPPKNKSITTYLEGEILDFRRCHTLLTTSFSSNLRTDAEYWRKLPPFSHLSDETLVHKLVSRKGHEELSKEWILMRWKERQFVRPRWRDAWAKYSTSSSSSSAGFAATSRSAASTPPNDTPRGNAQVHTTEENMKDEVAEMHGHGLTISGFYYVCLRRSTGEVEGLYYDPQSSPYQHLRLGPVRMPGMGCAAVGLR